MIAPDLATILWKYGAAGNTYDLYILSLSLFGTGVVFFTVHYLVLRGFYALERTRTVFFIQCAVAATNIVVAIVLVARTDPRAHGARSGAGLHRVVRRRLGRLLPRAAARARRAAHCRSWCVSWSGWPSPPGRPPPSPSASRCCCPGRDEPSHLGALLRLVVITGADVLVFLALTRALRLTEVTAVLDTVTRRLRPRSRSSD